MSVKIGHAYSDENSRAKGGKAGDQTGKELLIQDWYLKEKSWTAVFRAKSNSIAEKIAKAMEQACTNNNIGYDQSQRTTLFKYAEKYTWDLSKITEKCECDCSSLVSVCINAAGITVSKDMYTGNQKAVLQGTGKFEILTDTKYLTKPNWLKRGDIILGTGHTAVVLTDGVAPDLDKTIIDSAKNFNSSFKNTYMVVAINLNVRQGAGIDKKILVTIPKGTKVICYGYYTRAFNTNWLYVQFTYKNSIYNGFVSSKYLLKIS
jgi:hypothetical protein